MVLEFYCLFSEHLGLLASEIQEFLTVFTVGLSLARFWRAFGISGGFEHPKPPPRYATEHHVPSQHRNQLPSDAPPYPIKLKSLSTPSCKSEDLTFCEGFTLELCVIMSRNCTECVTNYSRSLLLMISHYSLMFINSISDLTLLTMHFTAFIQHYMF